MNLQNKKQMSDEELMLEAEISEVYDRIRRVDILIKMIDTQIHSYEEAQQIDKANELRTTLEQMNSIKTALLNKYTEVMSKAGRVMYQKYIPQQEQVGNLGLEIDNKNEKKKKKTVDDIVKAINNIRLPGAPDKNIAVPAVVQDKNINPGILRDDKSITELAIALGKDIAFMASVPVRNSQNPNSLLDLQKEILRTKLSQTHLPQVLRSLSGRSLVYGSTTIKSYLDAIRAGMPGVTNKTLALALDVMEGKSDSFDTEDALMVLLCHSALSTDDELTARAVTMLDGFMKTSRTPAEEANVKEEEVKGEGMFVPRIHSMVLPIGTRFRDDADVSVTEKDEAYQQNVEQRQQLYREYYKKLYGKEPSSDDVKQAFPENVEPIKKRFRLA